ncbi:MAG: tetratricopeptide repeat protein, partial [Bacteroidota bacterium]
MLKRLSPFFFSLLLYPAFLCCVFQAMAQDSPTPSMSTLPKDSLIAQGERLMDKGVALTETNLDSSLYYKVQALDYFDRAQHWEGYVNALNSIAFIYYYQGNYEQSNAYAEHAFQKAEQYLDIESQPYSDALNNLSVFLRQKGDYEKAIQLYKKSLDIQKRIQYDKAAIAGTYHNLGQVHKRKGDVEEAIAYYQQALELRLDTFGTIHLEVARNYLVLGLSHWERAEAETALGYYRRCLNIASHPALPQGKRTQQVLINTFQNIAAIHSKALQLDSTVHYIQLALALQAEDNAYRKSRSYEVLGDIYLKKQYYSQAIEYFQKAKTFALLEYRAFEKHVVFANLSAQIADAFLQQQKYEPALAYYQQALQEIAFEFQDTDDRPNPSLDQIFSKADALALLIGKAKALHQLARLTPTDEQALLLRAFQTCQLATEVIQHLRDHIAAEGSQYLLAEKALPVYEHGIELALTLHQKTGAQNYLKAAFAFAESNKAVLLLARLRDNTAKGLGGIPDSLLAKEKDLQLKLSFYEKKISQAKRKNQAGAAEKIKQWTATHFDLREQYKQLVQAFEQNYPKYFQLKYD